MDFDEFGLAIERLNRKRGYASTHFRIRKPGHYCRNTKLTVIVAVEPGDPGLPDNMDGSIARPRRWIRVLRLAGMPGSIFADFCNQVCTDIENNPIPGLDNHRVFLWDNLRAHQTGQVVQTVEGRGGPCHFTIVSWPPYQPKYGPIEYVILDLVSQLRKEVDRDWNEDIAEQRLYQVSDSSAWGTGTLTGNLTTVAIQSQETSY